MNLLSSLFQLSSCLVVCPLLGCGSGSHTGTRATAGCGSAQNNAFCASMSSSPPIGQPPQKSYKEFNNNWPLDSWQVTEPSDGYQVCYIRLLSKFVK